VLRCARPSLNLTDLYFAIEHLVGELKRAGVAIQCGRTYDGPGSIDGDTDVVVLATGAASFGQRWRELEAPSVVNYCAYLRGEAEVGQWVAVIASTEGAELAISLARSGKQVWLSTASATAWPPRASAKPLRPPPTWPGRSSTSGRRPGPHL
jgi:hypothetical protein